eukprot:GHVU01026419.1.p2 GENE.GHVU01026419.1~~GHVU01026419.1.p2  ORF type:complete len:119 (+),score=35.44 GHVU01026419.1:198-554(+)
MGRRQGDDERGESVCVTDEAGAGGGGRGGGGGVTHLGVAAHSCRYSAANFSFLLPPSSSSSSSPSSSPSSSSHLPARGSGGACDDIIDAEDRTLTRYRALDKLQEADGGSPAPSTCSS